MIKLPDLKTADIKGKRVFLRADIDVPLDNGKIMDDTRLSESLETLNYLLQNGAKVVLAGHLGRPQGVGHDLSAEPVARWYQNKLKIKNEKLKMIKIGELDAWEISEAVFVLENLRFDPGEESNDPEFSKKLAGLANIYVNDAFASYRAHSSTEGIARLLPHYPGFVLAKEINTLTSLMENPPRPLTVVIGGAKIDTKLPVVEKMHQIADYVLIGGLIAEETNALLKVQHEKIPDRKSALIVADLVESKDEVTPKDVENFLQIINLSRTVIWNGPVGVTEGKEENHEIATYKLAIGIVDSGVYSVVGGGDTIAYLKKIGLLEKFSFVSTGGGAMLEFLSGEKLPGIEALMGGG